jgi:hypothetical protein
MMGYRAWATLIALIGALIALSVCLHFFGVERSAVSGVSSPLWADREQAAGHSRSAPVGSITKGEVVDVLWDRYGKDYWACYVRTKSGVKGWLLCTDLDAATGVT